MKRRHKPNQSNLNFKYFVKRIYFYPWFWIKIRKSPSWISTSLVLDSLRSSVNVIFDHNSRASEEKQIPEIHPRYRFGHEEIKKITRNCLQFEKHKRSFLQRQRNTDVSLHKCCTYSYFPPTTNLWPQCFPVLRGVPYREWEWRQHHKKGGHNKKDGSYDFGLFPGKCTTKQTILSRESLASSLLGDQVHIPFLLRRNKLPAVK